MPDTSPIAKRVDEEKRGDYHSKLLIPDICDRTQEAIATGRPYQTILDPSRRLTLLPPGTRTPAQA